MTYRVEDLPEVPPLPSQSHFHTMEVVPQQREGEDDTWILSYVDLFTLLLVMFVVMLTFSSPKEETTPPVETAAKVEQARNVENIEKPQQGGSGVLQGQDQLLNRFERQLSGLVERGKVKIAGSAAGITLRLEEKILFGSGAAELVGEGKTVLQELAPSLERSGQTIVVEGHTDNRPIATSRFPSNWELSGARAARVARFLIQQGIPAGRVSATGYADTRPVAANDTAEGRARNRRVTILVKPVEG